MKIFDRYNARKVAMPPANSVAAMKSNKIFRLMEGNNSIIAKTAPFLAFSIVYKETRLTAIFTVLMPPTKIKKA